MNKIILILGTSGLLGNTIYSYLHDLYALTTFGAQRKITKNKYIFKFNAYNYASSIEKITKIIGHIDYVINCIGVFKDFCPTENLNFINSIFPQKLAELAKKHNFFLLHVSSDAVFPNNAGVVRENDTPFPQEPYGISKLNGEVESPNVITFRTSILGFSPTKHKGLLDWALKGKKTIIFGYTNQKWSGCTSLQFAKLCEEIIVKDKFELLRRTSNIYHFSPIGPFSKYKILKEFLNIVRDEQTVYKSKGKQITRVLKTRFFDHLEIKKYTHNVRDALSELIEFEKNHGNKL